MLKRDFTKSNKDYFNKNKIVLISLAVFLIIGIVIGAIFGFNGNFEVKGYNEFNVTIGANQEENYSKYQQEIVNVLNDYNAKIDTISIASEGDNTHFVVRYLNDITSAQEIEINQIVAEKLSLDASNVTEHNYVKPIVQNRDYIFTAVAILLIMVVASIFAYVRYNAASALAIIFACITGTLGFMCFSTILRLTIGISYFAMLVILNTLIVYTAVNLFETMHKSSWLMADDYDNAITTALKFSKHRNLILTIALMLIGVLFVLIAPAAIKYIAINILVMADTLLASIWYVIPFVWSVFITRCRKRIYKVKASVVENKTDKKDN